MSKALKASDPKPELLEREFWCRDEDTGNTCHVIGVSTFKEAAIAAAEEFAGSDPDDGEQFKIFIEAWTGLVWRTRVCVETVPRFSIVGEVEEPKGGAA